MSSIPPLVVIGLAFFAFLIIFGKAICAFFDEEDGEDDA